MSNYADNYFRQVCKHIKAQGFRVFIVKGTDSHYGYYSDGVGIGYFQLEWNGMNGVSLSTANKRRNFIVKGDVWDSYTIAELTREELVKAFKPYPDWVRLSERCGAVQWSGLSEFLNGYWQKDKLKEV